MATVQQLVRDLAQGLTSLRAVAESFETRPWPADPRVTAAQAAGVQDTPPPSPNSFDWVDIQPGLTEHERNILRQARDNASRVR